MKNRKTLSIAALISIFALSCADRESDYPIEPVPFTEVRISDTFWAPKVATNREVTIPFALNKNEETGRMDNFRKASGSMEGEYEGRRFNDTDVYKVLEGVAYSLSRFPDNELDKKMDKLIEEIAAAQEPDGYLYAARTVDPDNPAPGAGSERWINLQGSHELYNSGHLFEAAVAHYEATGKTNFLDIAIKNADLLVQTFGPDKRHDAPGHQVIEMGLTKLYRATGNSDYLELARFFLDQRGLPHESEPYPEGPFAMYNGDFYKQDHLPVIEQTEAWGHAVRAVYMYSGIADVASLLGDQNYQDAIDKIWDNVTTKKIYLTGGVGARHTTEAFGEDYELPNASAYTETCAAIGNVFWNYRMFLANGESKYIDILEKTMYNGLASGVSLSGDKFFYQNPLESTGNYRRSPWFDVSCCPGNIVRFLPSVPGYIYAKSEGELFVNLFIESEMNSSFGKNSLKVIQKSNYPWDGNISLTIIPERKAEFIVSIRIPGWAQDMAINGDLYRFLSQKEPEIDVRVNGETVETDIIDGYIKLSRVWEGEDEIVLDIPMPVRLVTSNENIVENRGKVAIQRGPIIYCLEETDNGDVFNATIPDEGNLQFRFEEGILNGTGVVEGKSIGLDGSGIDIFAIPYALWANREIGKMAVWIKTE